MVNSAEGGGYGTEVAKGRGARTDAIAALAHQDGFSAALLESTPCGVLVVDRDRHVVAVNAVFERLFEVREAEVRNGGAGAALRCVAADECGYDDQCDGCRVQTAILGGLAGNRTERKRAEVRVRRGDGVRNMVLYLSAAAFTHEGKRCAVVAIEDVTELEGLRRRFEAQQPFSGLVGRDEKMRALFEAVRQAARVELPVLIQGESGTEKELVAAAIHGQSPRARNAFLRVDCTASGAAPAERQMFGHAPGACSDPTCKHKGAFELARGGTVLLDEVDGLGRSCQLKVLRLIQDGAFAREGEQSDVSADVRIISATCKKLWEEVAAGAVRQDLFDRLCGILIHLPPLRERRTDISLLAEHLLRCALERAGRREVEVTLCPETLEAMMDYRWPGNVRELEDAVQYAVVRCRGKVLRPEHLPLAISGEEPPPGAGGRRRTLDAEAVREALREADGNKTAAARSLGVGRATLYRFLRQAPDSDR